MLDALTKGGPVLWLIAAMSVFAFGVFVERALHLHRARIGYADFLKGIFNVLRRGNTTEALSLCEDTPGPVAYLAKTAIQHRDEGDAGLFATLQAAGRGEITRLERRMVVIATTAQVTPVLGLLGTILKMVEALLRIQNQMPLVQKADVIGPLMQALIITAAGLMVAVPCYVAFNHLTIKIEGLVLDMERAAAELVVFFKGANASGEERNGA